MIETKLFEVRDRATCMVVLAQRFTEPTDREFALLARAGYGETWASQTSYVALVPIDGGHGHWTCDAYDHGQARTLGVIHSHLEGAGWNAYPTGTLLDVEFILGESEAPKASEIHA